MIACLGISTWAFFASVSAVIVELIARISSVISGGTIRIVNIWCATVCEQRFASLSSNCLFLWIADACLIIIEISVCSCCAGELAFSAAETIEIILASSAVLGAGLARSLILTVFAFWTLARVLWILISNKLEGGVAECAFTSVVFTFHAESTAVNTLVIDSII